MQLIEAAHISKFVDLIFWPITSFLHAHGSVYRVAFYSHFNSPCLFPLGPHTLPKNLMMTLMLKTDHLNTTN